MVPSLTDIEAGDSGCNLVCPRSWEPMLSTQMPSCDCYTEDECNAQLANFTPGACGEIGGSTATCDGGKNMCHYGDIQCNSNGCGDVGLCENCQNLRTAEACQDGVEIIRCILYLNWFLRCKS